MSRWSNNTMAAIETLAKSVDGAWSVMLKPHEDKEPLGKRQDYAGPEVPGVKYEWVNEEIGGGMTGDEFAGTVTFVLGQFHLVVRYW